MRIDVKITKADSKLEWKYNNKTDACFDIRSNADIVISARGKSVVPTGVYLDIPDGYMMQIKGRSGLVSKKGIQPGAGVIDSDYTGEIGVMLFNHSDEDFHIEKYDRIAQGEFRPVYQANFIEVDGHEEIDGKRGSNGFGSSGVK